jgi:hypothetical protein
MNLLNFSSELATLKDNNKVAINLLTFMAEDYKNHSHAIVEAIEQALYKVVKGFKKRCLTNADFRRIPASR